MKNLLLLLLVFINFQVFSQIEIGQRAQDVFSLVKYYVEDYNTPDSYGKTPKDIVKYGVEYDNGKIKDVIIYRKNTLLVPLMKVVNMETHYEIVQDTLASILTVYNTLSLDEVNKLKTKTSYKIPFDGVSNFYLTDNFAGYEVVFLNSLNIPCVRYFEEEVMFSDEKLKTISQLKQKIIQERSISNDNKYVNVFEHDPQIEDKIYKDYEEKIEIQFLRNHYGMSDTIRNILRGNRGFKSDSAVVNLRIERNDSDYGGTECKVEIVKGQTSLYYILQNTLSMYTLPKAKYQKINFVDLKEIDVKTNIGGFQFYIKIKKNERIVVNINNTKIPTEIKDELYNVILNDTNLIEKKTYTIHYLDYKVGNLSHLLTQIK